MGYQVAGLERRRVQPHYLPLLHKDDLTWSRTDLGARTLKTTLKGGPAWADVTRRITMNMKTGQVVKDQPAGKITRSLEHELIVGGPLDIITVLVYRRA